jgi:hypothetical protein
MVGDMLTCEAEEGVVVRAPEHMTAGTIDHTSHSHLLKGASLDRQSVFAYSMDY